MKKADPEPGRCRRTDGKKWRCAKEAFPDSKYCERHMHRGRNRSRKPVEQLTTTPPPPPPPYSFSSSSLTTSNQTNHHHHHHHPYHLYPYSSSSTTSLDIGFCFSPKTQTQRNSTTPHMVLNSAGSNYSPFDKDYNRTSRYDGGELKNERNFFSEASGTLRNVPAESCVVAEDDPWQLTPLRMSSSSVTSTTQAKERSYSVLQNGYSQVQLQNFSDFSKQQEQEQHQHHHCFVLGADFKSQRHVKVEREETQQPLRHFFD